MRPLQFCRGEAGVQPASQGDRLGRLPKTSYPAAVRGAGGGLVDDLDWESIEDPDWLYGSTPDTFWRILGACAVWAGIFSAPLVVLLVGLFYKGLL